MPRRPDWGWRWLAFRIKQSGVPGATLLGGVALPLVALTFGWRAAYVAGAAVAVLAAVTVPTRPRATAVASGARVLSRWLLAVAVATGMGSADRQRAWRLRGRVGGRCRG